MANNSSKTQPAKLHKNSADIHGLNLKKKIDDIKIVDTITDDRLENEDIDDSENDHLSNNDDQIDSDDPNDNNGQSEDDDQSDNDYQDDKDKEVINMMECNFFTPEVSLETVELLDRLVNHLKKIFANNMKVNNDRSLSKIVEETFKNDKGKVEIYENSKVYLNANRFNAMMIRFNEHESWKKLVTEILLEIYGTFLKYMSAKGSRGGVKVHPTIFKGIYDLVRAKMPDMKKNIYTKHINKICSNRRQSRNLQKDNCTSGIRKSTFGKTPKNNVMHDVKNKPVARGKNENDTEIENTNGYHAVSHQSENQCNQLQQPSNAHRGMPVNYTHMPYDPYFYRPISQPLPENLLQFSNYSNEENIPPEDSSYVLKKL